MIFSIFLVAEKSYFLKIVTLWYDKGMKKLV